MRVCVCARGAGGLGRGFACHLDAAYLYMLYMIFSFPVRVAGHLINRLFYTKANTTSKTTICDRKHTKGQVVAICRTRLL